MLRQQVSERLEPFAAHGLLTSKGDALGAWAEGVTNQIADAQSRPWRAGPLVPSERHAGTKRAAEHPRSAESAADAPRTPVSGGGGI